MKGIFHILFAFYFLSLSVIPCGDKEDCNEFKKPGISQATHQQDHDDEACTPFCVCSCCATHFLTASVENQFATASAEVQFYAEPVTSKVRGAVVSIWQPPKSA